MRFQVLTAAVADEYPLASFASAPQLLLPIQSLNWPVSLRGHFPHLTNLFYGRFTVDNRLWESITWSGTSPSLWIQEDSSPFSHKRLNSIFSQFNLFHKLHIALHFDIVLPFTLSLSLVPSLYCLALFHHPMTLGLLLHGSESGDSGLIPGGVGYFSSPH